MGHRSKWVKITGILGGILIFLMVRMVTIPEMTTEAQGLLAVLSAAVIFWITNPIPIYLTGFFVAIAPWILDLVPFNTAFSGFAGNTFWFLFAALGIAGCISHSGVPTNGKKARGTIADKTSTVRSTMTVPNIWAIGTFTCREMK